MNSEQVWQDSIFKLLFDAFTTILFSQNVS